MAPRVERLSGREIENQSVRTMDRYRRKLEAGVRTEGQIGRKLDREGWVSIDREREKERDGLSERAREVERDSLRGVG